MTATAMKKSHANGYDLIQVHNSAWLVCTHNDRLASFNTEEQARAYAFALPAHLAKAASGR